MLKCNSRELMRCIHTLRPLGGSQIKEKLRYLKESNAIMNKSSKELEKIKAKKGLELKNIRKKAYSGQQAIHVLKTKYDISNDQVTNSDIGPASKSDSKFLTLIKDRRMLYTILGVNGEQLRDSKLVADDVKKFLKRGQVEKAVFLARLAKRRGAAAMNTIMEYYLKELKFPQSAVQIYNWRKKWGIPPNEYTHTILFDGLAQQSQHISKSTGEMVLRIVDNLIQKDELSQIEFNAALGALSNCTEVIFAFELYERKIDNVHKDAITFLWMLRTCCRVKTGELFQELINGVMEQIPARYVDSQLIFEYCKALSSRSEDQIKRTTLLALCHYYDFAIGEKKLPIAIKDAELLPLSHWSLDKKFDINSSVIGLFLENCLNCGEYKLGISVFEDLKSCKPALLDLGMYYSYLNLLIRGYPTTCAEKCLRTFQEMESNGNLISTKHSIILVYRAFKKQSSKKALNGDGDKVQILLNTCQSFMKEQEGVYAKELKQKILPFQSWKYLVSIFKEANACNKVYNEKMKDIVDDFCNSFCSGEFDSRKIRNKDKSDQKFIELEIIRLLKKIAGRLEIPDVETTDTISEGPLRDTFLLRRLVLRLKDKLIEHVNIIENRMKDEQQIEDLEWSVKQICQKLLSSQISKTVDAN